MLYILVLICINMHEAYEEPCLKVTVAQRSAKDQGEGHSLQLHES